ncbi:MAG: deaminase, partial [Acidobacteriota bacterium]
AAFSASSSAMRACASTATFYFAARGEWWTIARSARLEVTGYDYFLGQEEVADRFVGLLFGDPRIAATTSELAMYLAQATSVQSLATSRRVGAALVAQDNVIAVGCNEVPEEELPDVHIGEDTSEQLKRELLRDTLDLLNRAGLLAPEKVADPTLLVSEARTALKDSQLMSLIEYQRPIHAEVAAISNAAKRGQSVAGANLYCTTFPCHLCFKSILAAGIERVHYVEPYPKSRAEIMFPRSSHRLTPYEGVAPRMYMQLFGERPVQKADADGRLLPPVFGEQHPLSVPTRDASEIADDEATETAKLKLDERMI